LPSADRPSQAAWIRRCWSARSGKWGRTTLNNTEALIACAVLALATMAFIFYVREDESDFTPHRTQLDSLMDRRDAIYENLRDLRFEYRAGKFSEGDYEETKALLEVEAARVLASMDELMGATPTPATRQAAREKVRQS
jgi:hypothetical protein